MGLPATPLAAFERVEQVLGHRYPIERLVAMSQERALFRATDRVLRRPVSLRVNFYTTEPYRAWFLREAQALGQLDHPAVRHLYDAGVIEDVAYRIGNWIEGEGLDQAVQRGPRPIPTVIRLARDLLSAIEHANAGGILLRRVTPSSIITNAVGRGTVTDLRFSSYVVEPGAPPDPPTDVVYMAPEIRDGEIGDPAVDIYAAGAVLYAALTGQAPPRDPAHLPLPSDLRAGSPKIFDRILGRALHRVPGERYLSALEMLEDLVTDAGAFDATSLPVVARTATGGELPGHWEKRLRRALGDDYELLEELGTGAFGRVYRVLDLHLERNVAMKVLNPALTLDLAVVERFRREAQLAARLHHPHIVRIYDIGGRGGLIWYTMELVPGPSLAKLVDTEGPQPVDRVLRIVRDALGALAHAHHAGLVHRDLKPENLLLEADGSVRITDFGLAIALRRTGRHGGATSQSGTPQFASPEQLLGERVDPRTDLYSLAAVAYFALLGHPPFMGRTPEEILARQTTDQIPSLATHRPDVPPGVERVLARALRANPEDRYASSAEFLHALSYATRGEPAGPPR